MNVKLHEVGDVLKYHRKRSGLSQKDLANLAGVGKTVVFDIEKGKQSVRLDTLYRVLAVLNLSLILDGPLVSDYEAQLNRGGDHEAG